METFPEDLEDADKDRILLKYPYKRLNGILVWAGLSAAKTSGELWRKLLTDERPVLEIGIFLKGKRIEHPLLGENGVVLKMNMSRTNGSATYITPPTTYQVGF